MPRDRAYGDVDVVVADGDVGDDFSAVRRRRAPPRRSASVSMQTSASLPATRAQQLVARHRAVAGVQIDVADRFELERTDDGSLRVTRMLAWRSQDRRRRCSDYDWHATADAPRLSVRTTGRSRSDCSGPTARSGRRRRRRRRDRAAARRWLACARGRPARGSPACRRARAPAQMPRDRVAHQRAQLVVVHSIARPP